MHLNYQYVTQNVNYHDFLNSTTIIVNYAKRFVSLHGHLGNLLPRLSLVHCPGSPQSGWATADAIQPTTMLSHASRHLSTNVVGNPADDGKECFVAGDERTARHRFNRVWSLDGATDQIRCQQISWRAIFFLFISRHSKCCSIGVFHLSITANI